MRCNSNMQSLFPPSNRYPTVLRVIISTFVAGVAPTIIDALRCVIQRDKVKA